MIRFLCVAAAVVFFVCAAAEWGVGSLTQLEEIAVGLALYVGSELVAPTVSYVRTRRVPEDSVS